ncbi:MAG: hypothetical protein NW220_15760 [Leptolyngbyaceae cyanobacterium bins.349]|nr:hypothetical protein [Leptolyngbyaceae cyanobacterium bins.349]
MQTIAIPVEPDIQVAFEQASDEERQALGVLISLFLKEGWSKKSLLEVMQEIGNRAKNRGLTPEILPEILEETQPEQKPRLMAQLRRVKISAAPDLSINHDRHF